MESLLFHRNSLFDERLSYFALFGLGHPGVGVQKRRNASANILSLESLVFHRSSLFDECLSYFARFGLDHPGVGVQKMRNASANILLL